MLSKQRVDPRISLIPLDTVDLLGLALTRHEKALDYLAENMEKTLNLLESRLNNLLDEPMGKEAQEALEQVMPLVAVLGEHGEKLEKLTRRGKRVYYDVLKRTQVLCREPHMLKKAETDLMKKNCGHLWENMGFSSDTGKAYVRCLKCGITRSSREECEAAKAESMIVST